MNNIYHNYHKHTHYSGIYTPDTHIKIIDYINRIKELGHNSYFTTEHGSAGSVFEALTLCEQNDIRCMYGMEGYIVKNPLEKDNRNYHIMIIPVDNTARKKVNLINSRANIEGFYYKPRIFIEDLLKLNPNEIYITSACIGGLLKDKDSIKDILIPLIQHFGNHMLLEVQSHQHILQCKVNKLCLKIAEKYNLKLIAANDSHYIYPEQAKDRLEFLKGKGITYGEEDTFVLDYPDNKTLFDRFEKQGILNRVQILEAIQNTLLFDDCEEIKIDKSIKMPTLYPNLTPEQKVNELKNHVVKKFKKIIKEDNITKEELPIYKQGIYDEMKVIEDTKEINTADYFLFNEKLVDLAIDKYGGVLTRTGRGCFTKDALVHTDNGLKTINNVVIGDNVIDLNGEWKEVVNTMKYHVKEDMIKITHVYGTDKYFPMICTKDHQILIHRNDNNIWCSSSDIQQSDYVCIPKIKHDKIYNKKEYIDLNDYNCFDFTFDDKYIYEYTPSKNSYYKYSPSDVARNINTSKSFVENIANGKKKVYKKKPEKEKEVFDYIPFNTLKEYRRYLTNKRTRRIKRYIKKDYVLGLFIGLMYGDGFNSIQQSGYIGLAINSKTHKNIINRKIFNIIANRIKAEQSERESKKTDLIQLFLYSKVFKEFVSRELFISHKGELKEFNKKLLYNDFELKKGIVKGLLLSDGHIPSDIDDDKRIDFDNTSLSIINAYKLLDLEINQNINSISFRKGHCDNRGYVSKDSYKLRNSGDKIYFNIKKKERCLQDDNYIYLPIKKIEVIKDLETDVYDLEIKESHSYLLNNMIVHNSCSSFYINRILGMTQLDRFKLDIKLYPERFMSTARLLENKALPDIDYNVVSQEPFVKAAKELLGENGCYPMIAYGTMQLGEAFRNVCRSHGLEYDIYNEIAKDIEHHLEDEKWKSYIEEAKKYVDSIVSASVHPCAFILDNKDLREEYGVVKIGEHICCLITSNEADEYKMLKDDFLVVSVWLLISETFKLIGKPIISIKELYDSLDDRIWDLFANGITCTLNQVDSDWATDLVKKFKPKTVSDMGMFVACLRPFFNSWRDRFITRDDYSTGSEHLDKVLESTNSYILFQENLMQYFEWLGVTPAESIGLIKKISKKKIKKKDFNDLEERIKKVWVEKTGTIDKFQNIWNMIQECMFYGFCSAHACATATDALYGAYLKANYPLEYYSVALSVYSDDMERTKRLTDELDYFNIKLNPIKFGKSSSKYTMDKKNNTIYKGIASIKFCNTQIAEELMGLSKNKYDSFIELLDDITNKTSVNNRQLHILAGLNFFSAFGKNKYLLDIITLYNGVKEKPDKKSKKKSPKTILPSIRTCKQLKKEKFDIYERYGVSEYLVKKHSNKETAKQYSEIDNIGLLKELSANLENVSLSVQKQCEFELEYLEYITYVNPKIADDYYIVSSFKTYKSETRPYLTLRQLKTGEEIKTRIKKSKVFERNPFGWLSILKIEEFVKDNKSKMVNGEWVKSEETEIILEEYDVVK